MKKLKYFFASAIVLVAVAVSTIVFAEYKEQKGDIRFGNSISNNSITVTEGNLVEQGDIQINKTVSKIDDNGNYKVTFEVKGKDVETHTSNKKDVYAVVVLDKSGSMCNSYNCSKDEKWTSAVDGAKTFASTLHEKLPNAKIALVTFSGSKGWGDNAYNDTEKLRDFAKADFSNVNFGYPDGGTNLYAGLYEANKLLTSKKVPKDAIKYVVVISDGEPTYYYDDNGYTKGQGSYMNATTEAKTKEMAKTVQKSAEVFAIGYDYNGTILSEVASGADHVYLSDPTTIVTKFTDIATIMGKANAGSDATLTDNIGAKFIMTDAQGNKYTSEKFDITEAGKTFSFNIKINEEDITEDGWYPTNADFELTYTDPNGTTKTIKSIKNPEVYWVAKRYDYKIEYYYDEQIDNTLTETGKDVKGKEITVSEESIKNNTKEGYSFVNTDPSTRKIVISSSEENVIRVYYERNSYDYEVHYFFNGNEDESLIERKSAKFNDVISTYTDKVKTGYKLDRVENLPLTIKTKGNVINVYYVTDETQTKELSYTVEYYKDGKKVDNDTQVIKETKQVLESDTLTVKKGEINVTNKYVGYKFEKTNPETIPNSIEDKGVIKVYYVKDMFEYTINYYYNGKIDNSKTESSKAKYETVISTYPDKKEVGYKLEKTENLPLTVTEDKTKNVINVYYVTDENQTKELSYTVEYYKDGNKVANDTQVVKQTKQVLESDTLTVEKGEINVTNKYVGYKFEKTNPETIPNSIEDKGVIKVYYVIDENQTKELSYTVEYYKDGKKVENDTQVVKQTKQVLESDTLTVKKGEINVTDKYVGYSFVKTEPSTIPNSINDKGIIRVYYERNSYDYEVHYFFNGNEDESLIERKSAKYNDVINTYTDKVKTGYKLQKVENLPLTVTEDKTKNVINVYYVTDENQTKELSYTVEYYKDGKKVENDTQKVTETKQVLESDTLTIKKGEINVTDKYVGYKFEKTNPETIPNSINDKGVIKVYYVFDENQTKELSYTVEYYKNGKKVENDTQVEVVTVHVLEPNTLQVNQDKINTENKYVGYKLEKTNPETIPSEINNGGIIKVYYILDDGQTKTLTYTVNYYKDGNLVKDDTETIYETKQVLESDTLTVKSEEINIKDKYVGYKFVKTNPELIPEVIENKGVIDVYYEKDTFTYEVRYYFNRELDESLTEKSVALYGDKITSYTDKVKEDYTLETVENLPLVISEDESKNIINVYYKIDGQGVIEPIEPPHTSANNSIYALVLLVNALGASVLLKKREN